MTLDDHQIGEIMSQVTQAVAGTGTREIRLQKICRILQEEIPHYDWVGFYLPDDAEQNLELGPYVGAPTEHTRIPYGKGICGQVAEAGRTYVIQDVRTEDNYLACSLDVLSEIVVPILKDDHFVGELDIDSHAASPFTEADERLLEGICQRLARLF